jgi:hypothetical protein
MAVVTINDVIVLNNPALFTSPYKFEIFFEASSELSEGLLSLEFYNSTTSYF